MLLGSKGKLGSEKVPLGRTQALGPYVQRAEPVEVIEAFEPGFL